MHDIQNLRHFRSDQFNLSLLTQFHANHLVYVITFGGMQQIIRRYKYKNLCEQEKEASVFLAKFVFFACRIEYYRHIFHVF